VTGHDNHVAEPVGASLTREDGGGRLQAGRRPQLAG
jgi:hypothetical protein